MNQGMGPERAERHRERTERCGAGGECRMLLFLLKQGVKERKRIKKKAAHNGAARLAQDEERKGAVSQGRPQRVTQTPNAVRGSAIVRRARRTTAPMSRHNGALGGS